MDGYTSARSIDNGTVFRTEVVSIGFGRGVVFTTGDASEMTLNHFEGFSKSFEVNLSGTYIDAGIQISVSEPYNTEGHRLIMFGSQISVGAGTPVASFGYSSKTRTDVHD